MCSRVFLLAVLVAALSVAHGQLLPVIINTWPFVDANYKAVQVLKSNGSYLDAVELGCAQCEVDQCDGTVGYGGSPDEKGETTLDAMIMDGVTHDVGSVGCLKSIKQAISVARSIMEHTEETLLVGDDATDFAVEMGFQKVDLCTNTSIEEYKHWLANNCQPNYWKLGTVSPDPVKNCGPYKPATSSQESSDSDNPAPVCRYKRPLISKKNHDTIGMIVIDAAGRVACGTSTNGASHKVSGRVGDSPITGAGCYVDKEVGGAAATGDGDVMMRFLPTYQTVENMRRGFSPSAAAEDALKRIVLYYPNFSGAIIAVNVTGSYGAANYGFSGFEYTVYNPKLGNSTVIHL